MSVLTIGIDFDGTFAADPELWQAFVAKAVSRGHQCVLVTGRSDQRMLSDPSRHWGDEVRALVGDLMPIVFAGHEWKKVAARKAGFIVDVWIDDNPFWIMSQEESIILQR